MKSVNLTKNFGAWAKGISRVAMLILATSLVTACGSKDQGGQVASPPNYLNYGYGGVCTGCPQGGTMLGTAIGKTYSSIPNEAEIGLNIFGAGQGAMAGNIYAGMYQGPAMASGYLQINYPNPACGVQPGRYQLQTVQPGIYQMSGIDGLVMQSVSGMMQVRIELGGAWLDRMDMMIRGIDGQMYQTRIASVVRIMGPAGNPYLCQPYSLE